MGEFVYFTEEQKQRANAVDLEDFLSRQVKKETGVFDKNICLSYNALNRKADR